MTTSPVPHPVQPSFDDLGRHLATTAFVVVDLETTGAGPDATITEVGAVRVQSGEVVGEFQTLVNPCTHIPPSGAPSGRPRPANPTPPARRR